MAGLDPAISNRMREILGTSPRMTVSGYETGLAYPQKYFILKIIAAPLQRGAII
jgi:hypothetical protein